MADSMMAADIPECAQREILVQSIKETVTEFLPRKTVFITARKKDARGVFGERRFDVERALPRFSEENSVSLI
jgi:hypothetical protein